MEPKEKYEEEIYICDNILGLESLENEKSSESEYDYDYECMIMMYDYDQVICMKIIE